MNPHDTRRAAATATAPSLKASIAERVDFDADTDPGFRLHEEAAPASERTVKASSDARATAGKKRRRMSTDARRALALLDDPASRVKTLARKVSNQVERQPVLSILVGFGIGFAIGGALSTRFGRIALMAAGRYAMKELISGI